VGLVWLGTGCLRSPAVAPQIAAGTYRSVVGPGAPVVLHVEEDRQTVRAWGTVDGAPIVIAASRSWRAVGALTRADGTTSLVRLGLSADGTRLVLESEQGRAVLEAGAAAGAVATGPFSGTYRAVRDFEVLLEASLVQRGPLVSGVAVFRGRTAGITGHVTGADLLDGLFTFRDESQIPFQATLLPDGRRLRVLGLGGPLELSRR
jgi:hypothetical protein